MTDRQDDAMRTVYCNIIIFIMWHLEKQDIKNRNLLGRNLDGRNDSHMSEKI